MSTSTPLSTVMPMELVVQLVDLLPLGPQPLGVQAVGHGHAFGMVGDGDVLQPAGLSGFDHFLQRCLAVRGHGMHVQIADHVVDFDEPRQRTGGGPLEFETCFADLRRKAGQVQVRHTRLLPCGRPRICHRGTRHIR